MIDSSLSNFLSNHCGTITNFNVVGKNKIGKYQFNSNGNTYAIKTVSYDTANNKKSTGDAIAIQHLRKFYTPKLSNNYMYILHVKYNSGKNGSTTVQIALLEDIPYSDFTIGNIGRGQLQLKGASDIYNPSNMSRKEWMKTFYKDFIITIPQIIKNLIVDLVDSQNEVSLW